MRSSKISTIRTPMSKCMPSFDSTAARCSSKLEAPAERMRMLCDFPLPLAP